MDKKLVLEEINGLVEIISEQTGTIMTYPGKIPHIEIDIVLSNIRKLYENYHLLNRMNTAELPQHLKSTENIIIEPAARPVTQVRYHEPEFQAPPPQIKPVIQPQYRPEPIIHPVEDEPQHTPEPTHFEHFKPLAARQPQPVDKPVARKDDKIHSTSMPDLFSGGSPTISDRHKEERPSVADKISQSMSDNSVANKLQQKPLADIRAAIGINEKFLFINELFNGNLQEYNHAIQALNTALSGDRGLEIFEAYRSRYGWNPKLTSFLKLRDLVERRYL
jgi:hypothetical protein